MLGHDVARALDPALIMRDAGMEPDAWQERALRSSARRCAWLACRQSGKSTTAAAIALWTALYDGGLVLLVSPSLRQSGELFRKVIELFTALPEKPTPASESALRLELPGGGRVISLPGTENTIRGYSGANLVILDEAARIADELVAAVRPMLATTNGRLIALTTPAGQRGWFYETWTSGAAWERVQVVASQCPRITPEFLADEERELGPTLFRQEYECSFEDTDEQAFPTHLIDRAFTAEVRPLWP